MSEEMYATHGCKCKKIGADGISRNFMMYRFPNGVTEVRIETYWDGEDAPPLATSFALGDDAFSGIQEMLFEFGVDRERFRIVVPDARDAE